MDLNTYRKNVEDAKNRYLEQSKAAVESASKAGGFGADLSNAIKQREDTFATLNNDVNTKRANYYNSSEQVLPQLFEQYKNDPLYALQALGNENTTRQIAYRNADDIRNQKQGRIEDYITSFSQAAQREAARQEAMAAQLKEAYGIADNEYQRAYSEDQSRKAAAAQASYLASLGGGNGNGNGQPVQTTRVPVGQKDATGKTIMGYDASGNPVYQEDQTAQQPAQKNFLNYASEAFNPANWAPVAQNALGDNYQGARDLIKKVPPLEQLIQGGKQAANYVNSFANLFR